MLRKESGKHLRTISQRKLHWELPFSLGEEGWRHPCPLSNRRRENFNNCSESLLFLLWVWTQTEGSLTSAQEKEEHRCVGKLVWQLRGGESPLYPESTPLSWQFQAGKTSGTREGSDVGMAWSYFMSWQRSWPRRGNGTPAEKNLHRMGYLRARGWGGSWGSGRTSRS